MVIGTGQRRRAIDKELHLGDPGAVTDNAAHLHLAVGAEDAGRFADDRGSRRLVVNPVVNPEPVIRAQAVVTDGKIQLCRRTGAH